MSKEQYGLKKEKGFTLVEILIAVSLVSVIFSFVFGVLTSNLEASQKAESRMEIAHTGRFFIGRITGDLIAASLMPNSKSGAFIGKDVYRDGKSKDELFFTAFTRSHLTLRPPVDQSEIGYYFELLEDGTGTLMRRESDVIDSQLETGGESYQLSDRVEEMTIRYLGSEGWVDAWDSTVTDTLPKAVSVEITITDENGPHFFSTIVRLPT